MRSNHLQTPEERQHGQVGWRMSFCGDMRIGILICIFGDGCIYNIWKSRLHLPVDQGLTAGLKLHIRQYMCCHTVYGFCDIEIALNSRGI